MLSPFLSPNPVRQALLARRLTVGSWMQIGHPTSAEILAEANFEWIAVDMEHSDIELDALAGLLRAMHGRGVVPLVRVRENQTLAIRQALDLGAAGVIVPLIQTAEDARQAVTAAKYPPLGARGYGYCRANEWGKRFDQTVPLMNDYTIVIPMIESERAVDNIESILRVEGIDGVFIGPYDMSGSYGITGQIDHHVIQKACNRVAEACRRASISAGLHIIHPTAEAIRQAMWKGFTFIALGADIIYLRQSAMEAREAAERIQRQLAETAPKGQPTGELATSS